MLKLFVAGIVSTAISALLIVVIFFSALTGILGNSGEEIIEVLVTLSALIISLSLALTLAGIVFAIKNNERIGWWYLFLIPQWIIGILLLRIYFTK
jgi:hypothetical protein